MRFVTAFLDLHEDRSKDKSYKRYSELFDQLAQTGIPIHLFLSEAHERYFKPYPNVMVEFIELEQLHIYKLIRAAGVGLPPHRTGYHDTANFLTVMNAKNEFIYRSMQRFTDETQFAWIDYGIFHVFNRPVESARYLQMLAKSTLRTPGLHFPGAWPPESNGERLFSMIYWRFCGGFFMGDRDSLLQMWNTYMENFYPALKKYNRLTWEVNMWAYLESHAGLKINWYNATHDDSIIRVPTAHFKTAASLTSIPPRFNVSLRPCIDSLLNQVDHIYLALPTVYDRFSGYDGWVPTFLQEEPYVSRVTVTRPTTDMGPATKYLGSLSVIPANIWVFVCDDDQEYADGLVRRMMESVGEIAVYQNHYHPIQTKTSGGMIHGYVGCMINSSCMKELTTWPLPDAAKFVDDQWMSIYCFKQGLPVRPTGAREYRDIFKSLDEWHEKIGLCSLAGLQNRDEKVAEVASFFGIRFTENGGLTDDHGERCAE